MNFVKFEAFFFFFFCNMLEFKIFPFKNQKIFIYQDEDSRFNLEILMKKANFLAYFITHMIEHNKHKIL